MAGVTTNWYSRNILLLHMLCCYWRTTANMLEATGRPLRFLHGNSIMQKISDGHVREKYSPQWYDNSRILVSADEQQYPFLKTRNNIFQRSRKSAQMMPIDITILNTRPAGSRPSHRRIMGVDISLLTRLPDVTLPISNSPFLGMEEPMSENYMLNKQTEYPYNRWHIAKGGNLHYADSSSNNETNEIIIFPAMSFPFKKTLPTPREKKSTDSKMQFPENSPYSEDKRIAHYVPELFTKFSEWPLAEVPIAKHQATIESRESKLFRKTPYMYGLHRSNTKLTVPEIYTMLPENLEYYQELKERKKRSNGSTERKGFN